MNETTEQATRKNIIDGDKLTTFLVVGPGIWGKGKELMEAVKNCKKNGYSKGDKLIAYIGTEDIGFDGAGYVVAKGMIRLGDRIDK